MLFVFILFSAAEETVDSHNYSLVRDGTSDYILYHKSGKHSAKSHVEETPKRILNKGASRTYPWLNSDKKSGSEFLKIFFNAKKKLI